MNAKNFLGTLAWLTTGLAAGYLLSHNRKGIHIRVDIGGKQGPCRKHGPSTENTPYGDDRPPLRVKPVPLAKKADPESDGEPQEEKTQEETE